MARGELTRQEWGRNNGDVGRGLRQGSPIRRESARSVTMSRINRAGPREQLLGERTPVPSEDGGRYLHAGVPGQQGYRASAGQG